MTVSSDDFREDVRVCKRGIRRGLLRYERWHGWQDTFETLEVPVDQTARHIQIVIPAASTGEPLVCQEVEVYGQSMTMPTVKSLIPVDLNADGQLELVAVCMPDEMVARYELAGEIVALNQDGTELWRWQAPNIITHVSCHDLDGNGRQQVCVGILGPELVEQYAISREEECRLWNEWRRQTITEWELRRYLDMH